MNELTLTVLRLGFLVVLWLFVFAIVGVLRGDLYGTRVVARSTRQADRRPAPTARPRRDSPAPEPARAERGAGRFGQGGSRGHRGEPRELVVTAGPLSGTTLPLRESGTLIGRNPESALVLDDDYASGRHARIYRGPESWVVEDLGSTNGTFIGSERLHGSAPVRAGTVLRFGKTVVELRR